MLSKWFWGKSIYKPNQRAILCVLLIPPSLSTSATSGTLKTQKHNDFQRGTLKSLVYYHTLRVILPCYWREEKLCKRGYNKGNSLLLEFCTHAPQIFDFWVLSLHELKDNRGGMEDRTQFSKLGPFSKHWKRYPSLTDDSLHSKHKDHHPCYSGRIFRHQEKRMFCKMPHL